MKKNKSKIILVLLVIGALMLLYYHFFMNNKKTIDEKVIIDSIPNYDYILYNNKTDIYKEEFKKLKQVLSEKEINWEEYAKEISKLFVIDFYTLDDKITNADIGGILFIHTDIRDNFILKARDTIYKNIKSNIDGKRDQTLPIVSSVQVEKVTNQEFKSDTINDDNSYLIELSVDYKKDLEYPSKVVVSVVHHDNKLYIVEVE